MNESYDKNGALVVLPPVSAGRLKSRRLRTWLAQSDISYMPAREELLLLVTRELGLPYPEQGLAALRMWGQTGDRTTSWIAAADPVYLEPRLDHLCLHALRRAGVQPAELRALIDHLQATLGEDDGFGFTRLGNYGYLSAKTPIATADVPAYVVDLQKPDDYLPGGDDAATHRNLLSEVEMALHDHETNQQREAVGQQPVNSLWLWGGGTAPEQMTRPQPPLFSDDPLLTGYWYASTALAEPWLGSMNACIENAVTGFVAVTPEFDNSTDLLEDCLFELRAALKSGRLSSLTLVFRDGVRAHVKKSHALRLWRRYSPYLEVTESQ